MVRTDEQLKNIREKSRKKIMDAGLSLFSTNGFYATSINMIAKEAGVASGLVYNYFENKEDLLEEIIEYSLQKFSTKLYPEVVKSFESQDLVQLLEVLFSEIKEQKESWRLYIRIMLEPSMDRFGRVKVEAHLNHIGDIFASILKAQGDKDYQKRVRTLIAIVHGALLNYIIAEDEYALDLVKEMLIKDIKTIDEK